MNTSAAHEEKTRFDTRLSKEQKLFFERAATLGGYRNLTDFILDTAQQKAKKIIEEHETVLASQKDRNIFFDALTNAPQPNEALKAAAQHYIKESSK